MKYIRRKMGIPTYSLSQSWPHVSSPSYMRGERFMELLKHNLWNTNTSILFFFMLLECVLLVTAKLNISDLSIIFNDERTSMSKQNDPKPRVSLANFLIIKKERRKEKKGQIFFKETFEKCLWTLTLWRSTLHHCICGL